MEASHCASECKPLINLQDMCTPSSSANKNILWTGRAKASKPICCHCTKGFAELAFGFGVFVIIDNCSFIGSLLIMCCRTCPYIISPSSNTNRATTLHPRSFRTLHNLVHNTPSFLNQSIPLLRMTLQVEIALLLSLSVFLFFRFKGGNQYVGQDQQR